MPDSHTRASTSAATLAADVSSGSGGGGGGGDASLDAAARVGACSASHPRVIYAYVKHLWHTSNRTEAVAQMRVMLEQTRALFLQSLRDASVDPDPDARLRLYAAHYAVMENASALAQLP